MRFCIDIFVREYFILTCRADPDALRARHIVSDLTLNPGTVVHDYLVT